MEVINAVGRRKSSVARIYLTEGKGNITVNNKNYTEYFPVLAYQEFVLLPLKLVSGLTKYDINANIDGGGVKGQAEALKLAISRALVKNDPEQRVVLKTNSCLSRDPRRVERKKPGQPGARKRFQFSKR